MKLPQMIRNLWIYRRFIALAVLLGIVLFFVASNRERVRVAFPFIGGIESTSGIVMLVSAALGAATCWLVMTFRHVFREARSQQTQPHGKPPAKPDEGRTIASEPEGKGSEGAPAAEPGKEAKG